MRLRLTPKDDSFYAQFERAAANLVSGAELLVQLVNGTGCPGGLAEELGRVEHANDEVTHDVFRHLNSTFVTPFDRQDIYQLGANLDDVMDALEAAGVLINLYGIDQVPAEFKEIADVLQRCAQATAAAMPRLQSLRELQPYWIEVNRLENEADQIHRRLVAHLFSGAYDALAVMKLKEVADTLEDAADAFEHVANTIETIALKES